MSAPTLAKRIREEREWLGADCGQCADMLGDQVETVEAWEAGGSVPTGEQMVRLTDVLGLSVERLHGAPLVENVGGALMCGGDPTHDDLYELIRFAEYLRHKKAQRCTP